MRLSSFEVSGFKNFVEPIKVEGLGTFVVLHGDNNVGKSNLLKAIQLFVTLLAAWRGDNRGLPAATPYEMTDAELKRWTRQDRSELFPLGVEAPEPMRLAGEFHSTREELDAAGIEAPDSAVRVRIALEFAWRPERQSTQLRFTSFCLANGLDLTTNPERPESRFAGPLSGFFARPRFDKAVPTIGSVHRVQSKRTDQATLTRLAETLHAARDSEDRTVAVRWERFEEAMRRFSSMLGDGRFVPIWPQGKAALLMFQTDRARIPLYLLGSGVQQVVSVMTDLLCSGAAIVAIEEPEVHLRTDAQELLREILRDLPGNEGSPSQIFVSSHAPTFELAPSFVHIHRGPSGHTRAAIRSAADAPAVLHVSTPDARDGDATTPISWLSSDGVLRLSARVRNHIGREQPGGVVVSISETEANTAEIRSTERFVERFGVEDESEG